MKKFINDKIHYKIMVSKTGIIFFQIILILELAYQKTKIRRIFLNQKGV